MGRDDVAGSFAAGGCGYGLVFVAGVTCRSRRTRCVHIVEGLGKIPLSGRLTAAGGILAFCGERGHMHKDGKKKKEYRFRLEYD